MGRVTETATLLYPRRAGGAAYSDATAGDGDVVAQGRAARLLTLSRFVTRFLLPVGLVAGALGAVGLAARPYRSIALFALVAGVAVAIGAGLAARVVSRAFAAADDAAGVPVPAERYDAVCQTYLRLAVVADDLVEAEFVGDDFRARLRATLPRIRRLDAAYFDNLQRMRAAWLGGDVARWRARAQDAADLADQFEAAHRTVAGPYEP